MTVQNNIILSSLNDDFTISYLLWIEAKYNLYILSLPIYCLYHEFVMY